MDLPSPDWDRGSGSRAKVEEMATFACAAGPVSRAVGMGQGVESSGWVSGASPWCFGSSLGFGVGSRLVGIIEHVYA